MYQETPTLLTVARWGAVLGIHPLHLQQVDVASTVSSSTVCGRPVMQFAYQANDRTSREDIAMAIQTAEATLTDYLGYSPLPDWTVQDVRMVDQDWRPEISSWGGSVVGYPLGVELRNGYLIGGGVKTTSVISAGAAIVYTDQDNDLYSETATVGPVATTVTDVNQVALFLQAADTNGGTAADPQYEIRPIKVTISGGFVTITFRRELAVTTDLLLELEPEAVNGATVGNFLTAVDVYRRYTDPTTSVTFQWDSGGWGSCGSCAACAYAEASGCILSHDDRNGLAYVSAGTYNADTGTWSASGWTYCRRPERAVVSYRAGYRDQRRSRPYYDMDPLLERCVAWMAAALLERPLCGCNNVNANLAQWRQDLAQTASNNAGSDSWQLSSADLANPFGTLRGQVQAWRMLTSSRDRVLGRRMAG